jgi:hypothetical protein
MVLTDRVRYDRCRDALASLIDAETAVRRALDAWKDRDRLYIKDVDPAKFLCARLQIAWATLDGDVPRSVNEESALCAFIADALKETNIRVGQGKTKGQPYTPAAISAVLSGKTDRLNFIRVDPATLGACV